MKREIIETGDGSNTIYIPEWNEHYHSSHGAIQEAQHVFIENGFKQFTEDCLTILEMGFGTGLNALLTFHESEKRAQYVHYIGLEAFPPSEAEWKAMNYQKQVNFEEVAEIYEKLHTSAWGKMISLNEFFVLEKRNEKLQNLKLSDSSIDLIYYDAFGPRVQEELWSLEIFEKLFKMLKSGGFLVTYCAKGQVKRDLKKAGFIVESLPGPPGKREMTRARKIG